MDIRSLLESIAHQETEQLDEARSLSDINAKAAQDLAYKKLEPKLNSHKKNIEMAMKAIKGALDSNHISDAIDSAERIRKSLEAMRTLISNYNTATDNNKIISDFAGKDTPQNKQLRKAQVNQIKSIKESCSTYREYSEELEKFIMEKQLELPNLDNPVPETDADLNAIKYPQLENMSFDDAHAEMQRLGDKLNAGQGDVDDIFRLEKMGEYKGKVLDIQKAERARRRAYRIKNPGVAKQGKFPYPFSGDNRRPRRSKWA